MSPPTTHSHIAVIIPAWNAEEFIAEALTSVLEQTLLPDEIVVVDDGSSDGTVERARAVDPSIRVLSMGENGGVGSARNAGVRATTADRIAFLDADDLWTPDHLANLGAALDRFPSAVMAFCRVRQFGDASEPQHARIPMGEPHHAWWDCTRTDVVYPQTSMTRRSAFDEAGGFRTDLRSCEDTEFFRRLAGTGPFVCVPEITVNYRRHPEQVTRPANQIPNLEAEYQIRRGWWEAARASADVDDVQRHREIFREFLDRNIASAWYRRDWRLLRHHVRLGRWVPGATGIVARWLPRLALAPVMPLVDRVRKVEAEDGRTE